MSLPAPLPPEQLAATQVAQLARPTLVTLRARLGLRAWVVARLEGDEWVPVTELGAEDVPGAGRFPWAALCAHLVRTGAVVVPRSSAGDALHGTAARRVGAYAGAPLRLPDGRVVGAVAGADRLDQPEAIRAELPLVALTGQLLSAALAAEVHAVEQAQRAETAETLSRRDPLTELGNRRAWDRLLVKEEERCRRQDLEAAVIVVDLDELKQVNDDQGHAAGDALLRRAAVILSQHTREPDDLARIGGDEFAIVASDCPPEARVALVERLRAALAEGGINASIGGANRQQEGGLVLAWSAADEAMYRDKRERRPSR